MFPLPEGWSAPDAVEDAIEVDGALVHRAGVSAIAPSGEEMCGSAADRFGPAPDRAWFELVERICTIDAIADCRDRHRLLDASGAAAGEIANRDLFPESDAPAEWTYARSNGVAIHRDWAAACRHARWELAERDRVLRSWRGEIPAQRIALSDELTPQTTHYEWLAASFGATAGSFSEDVAVVAMCGIPQDEALPFAIGFAGRESIEVALAAATREAVQQLAFMWGEPTSSEVAAQKPGAMLHLDTYQLPANRARVRRWLNGDHPNVVPTLEARADSSIRYVDLSASWLPSGLRVAKAVAPGAMPLVFGLAPAMRGLPPELRIHPIP